MIKKYGLVGFSLKKMDGVIFNPVTARLVTRNNSIKRMVKLVLVIANQ